MLTDTRIIHRHGGYDVLAERQVVAWPNGDTIGLHPVVAHGYADMFLRACRSDDLHWIIFDLRAITPAGFEADLKAQPRRDNDGMVLYTLRATYPGASACLQAALANFRAAWFAPAAVTEGAAA